MEREGLCRSAAGVRYFRGAGGGEERVAISQGGIRDRTPPELRS